MAGRAPLALLAALAVAGCGSFGRAPTDGEVVESDPFADLRDDAPSAGADAAIDAATGDLAPSSTTTIVAGPPSTGSPTTVAPTPVAGESSDPTVVRDGIENRSTVRDDGWRLEFTVDATERRRTDDRVLFEAVLVNETDRRRHHSVDQPDLFVIADFPEMSERAWSTKRCQSDAIAQPSLGLRSVDPDERTPFTGAYQSRVDRSGCALVAGDYVVFARILVCPDDAVSVQASGGATCDDGRARFVESGPVFLGLDEPS